MKQIIVSLLLVAFGLNITAAQENRHQYFSGGEFRVAYNKKATFGLAGLFGVYTDKMRAGLGFGYEETLIKIDNKYRSYAFLPIILRNELLSKNKYNAGICTELGCGVALMKKYETRGSGYFGIGFTLLNGKLSILFRRQLININNEENLFRNQIFASFGFSAD